MKSEDGQEVPVRNAQVEFRGVYIGGGNTFRLLAVLRRSGLLPALQRFVDNGGAVYGGSAGAAVLGADITTVAHLDVDRCRTTDTRGLDQVAGHGVFVHHRPQDAPRAQDWARRNRRPVVALHERAGAVIANGRMTAVGFESGRRRSRLQSDPSQWASTTPAQNPPLQRTRCPAEWSPLRRRLPKGTASPSPHAPKRHLTHEAEPRGRDQQTESTLNGENISGFDRVPWA